MQQDDLLKTKKTTSQEITSFDPTKEGLLILGLTENEIMHIGKMFNLVFEANNSSKNGVSMIKGALFSVGTKKYENSEWREHCAGSLRELLDSCSTHGEVSDWFCKAFKGKNKDFPSMKTNPNDYKKISAFYDYFSEIHHHNATYILYRLRVLYGQDIKTGNDSEELFIKVVKDFIQFLLLFFKKNAPNI